MTTIIRGRLTADPELRFTPNGAAVANFTIAEDVRKKQPTGEWETVATTFWRCSIWREAAENVTNSLHKGDAVLAVGQAKQRDYEHNGEKRSVVEVELDAIGPDLRWQTAKVQRGERRDKPSAADPWSTHPAPQQSPAFPDEPPF